MHQDPQRTTERYSKVEAGSRRTKMYLVSLTCTAHELEPHGIRVFAWPLPEHLVPEHPAAPIAMLVAIDMFTGCFLAAKIAPAAQVDLVGFALRVWRSHFRPRSILCDHAPSSFKADQQEPPREKGGGRG